MDINSADSQRGRNKYSRNYQNANAPTYYQPPSYHTQEQYPQGNTHNPAQSVIKTISQRKRNLLIIVGSVVGAAILLVAMGITVVVMMTSADSADKIMFKYLTALSQGDAQKALSYSDEQPSETTFLTSDILRKQIAIAPLTQINVTDNNGSGYIHYHLYAGSTYINDSIQLTKTKNGWKLPAAFIHISFDPGIVDNKIKLFDTTPPNVSDILVFPGALEFTSTSQYLDLSYTGYSYHDSYHFSRLGLSEKVRGEFQASISAAGKTAITAALEDKLRDCARDLPNDNACPISLRNESYYAYHSISISQFKEPTLTVYSFHKLGKVDFSMYFTYTEYYRLSGSDNLYRNSNESGFFTVP